MQIIKYTIWHENRGEVKSKVVIEPIPIKPGQSVTFEYPGGQSLTIENTKPPKVRKCIATANGTTTIEREPGWNNESINCNQFSEPATMVMVYRDRQLPRHNPKRTDKTS